MDCELEIAAGESLLVQDFWQGPASSPRKWMNPASADQQLSLLLAFALFKWSPAHVGGSIGVLKKGILGGSKAWLVAPMRGADVDSARESAIRIRLIARHPAHHVYFKSDWDHFRPFFALPILLLVLSSTTFTDGHCFRVQELMVS